MYLLTFLPHGRDKFDSINIFRYMIICPCQGRQGRHHIPECSHVIARSACRLADALNSPAIVVITRRGLLAQTVSSFRPTKSIIYAFTNMSSVRRKLWLLRSVVPFVIDHSQDPEKTIQTAFLKLRQRNRVLPGDEIVVVSDVATKTGGIRSVQVRTFHGDGDASGPLSNN